MIVVDVGCAPHAGDDSIGPLIERFEPDILFGFDPHPKTLEGIYERNGTTMVFRRAAAWTSGTTLSFVSGGGDPGALYSGVERLRAGTDVVAAFDLAALIFALPAPLVLKINAEGAEYPLLAHLAKTGADLRLQLVLVQWHQKLHSHGWYRKKRPVLACPVEEWTL